MAFYSKDCSMSSSIKIDYNDLQKMAQFGGCTQFQGTFLKADCKDDEIEFKYYNDDKCTDRNTGSGKNEFDTKPGQEVMCKPIGNDVYVYMKQTGWKCEGEGCPQQKKDEPKKGPSAG